MVNDYGSNCTFWADGESANLIILFKLMENNDKLIDAIKWKHEQVCRRYNNLNNRNNFRVPYHIQWIFDHRKISTKAKSFANLRDLTNPINKLDKLARTFCALEEAEEWLDKLEAGIKRHQEEMERQANTKICRLKTFVALTDFKQEKPEQDVPF